jgi:hypothetical protein
MSLLKWYRAKRLAALGTAEKETYPSWEKVQKVLVFFDYDLDMGQEQLRPWTEAFNELGAQVFILCYVPVKKKEVKPDFKWPYFAKNEKNWFGAPKGKSIDRIKQEHFDLYIDLSSKDLFSHHFLTKMIQSKFKVKVGARQENFDLWVHVDPVKEAQLAVKESLKYLKIINA